MDGRPAGSIFVGTTAALAPGRPTFGPRSDAAPTLATTSHRTSVVVESPMFGVGN
jgi:hypothetical protein